MATAYRHLGAGSHLQLNHFIQERTSEIARERERLRSEHDMWVAVGQRTDLSPTLWAHQSSRLAEIGSALNDLSRENLALAHLLALLNPCPDCNGYGETREFIAHDETRMHPCRACNSTGAKAAP